MHLLSKLLPLLGTGPQLRETRIEIRLADVEEKSSRKPVASAATSLSAITACGRVCII
jgi:hypothetical protein